MEKISDLLSPKSVEKIVTKTFSLKDTIEVYAKWSSNSFWSNFNTLELYLSLCDEDLYNRNIINPTKVSSHNIMPFISNEWVEQYFEFRRYMPGEEDPINKLQGIYEATKFYEIDSIFSFNNSLNEILNQSLNKLELLIKQENNKTTPPIDIQKEIDNIFNKRNNNESFENYFDFSNMQWANNISSEKDIISRKLPVSMLYIVKYKKEVKDISIFPCENYESSDDLIAFFSEKYGGTISSHKENKLSYYITKRTILKFIANVGYKGRVAFIFKKMISKKGLCQHSINRYNSDKNEIFFIRDEFIKLFKPYIKDYL
ncbi:hypothetical protein IL308_13145 [Lactococcus lactis]|uniref:hypothetical protein n=1 Tax=Lactococcus lactis TaxID=1358 RepID=UPI001912CBC3|nr:hypothetical protein [Lactococcus lactis]MBK5077680.1 hypothetical protein [Lactococcus lactis]